VAAVEAVPAASATVGFSRLELASVAGRVQREATC
jgi:hypothetical protein